MRNYWKSTTAILQAELVAFKTKKETFIVSIVVVLELYLNKLCSELL